MTEQLLPGQEMLRRGPGEQRVMILLQSVRQEQDELAVRVQLQQPVLLRQLPDGCREGRKWRSGCSRG